MRAFINLVLRAKNAALVFEIALVFTMIIVAGTFAIDAISPSLPFELLFTF